LHAPKINTKIHQYYLLHGLEIVCKAANTLGGVNGGNQTYAFQTSAVQTDGRFLHSEVTKELLDSLIHGLQWKIATAAGIHDITEGFSTIPIMDVNILRGPLVCTASMQLKHSGCDNLFSPKIRYKGKPITTHNNLRH